MTDTDNDTQQTSRQVWLDFLQSQGATISNGIVVGFTTVDNTTKGATSSSENTLLCDLSSRGIIKVSGEEAQSFLQNQFCNDLHNLNDTVSQLNGYCTPKGRLLAFFRLWQQNDCYYFSLPRERLAATLKRLQMYVLMSKVKLSDASDTMVSIGIAGNHTEALLREHFGVDSQALPTQVDQCLHHNEMTLIRVSGNTPRFEISGPITSIMNLWQQLSANTSPASEAAWQLLDIQAGVPQIVDATAEAFVPQMVNLELINALSFKKGCYPGQEIVARTHYLGKQKRRMYLAHVDTPTPPSAGDIIVALNDSSGQSVGTVVSAAAAANGGADLLAVLQIAQANEAELVLATDQNTHLTLKDLPYSVEVEGSAK